MYLSLSAPFSLDYKCVHISRLTLSLNFRLSPATTLCLPFTARLLEREIYANALHFFTSHFLLHPLQSGFYTRHSHTLFLPRPKVHMFMVIYTSIQLYIQQCCLLSKSSLISLGNTYPVFYGQNGSCECYKDCAVSLPPLVLSLVLIKNDWPQTPPYN